MRRRAPEDETAATGVLTPPPVATDRRYSFGLIPEMGAAIAGDRESYQYLVESIRRFPKQEEFRQIISDAGLDVAEYTNMTFGAVAMHSGFKLS